MVMFNVIVNLMVWKQVVYNDPQWSSFADQKQGHNIVLHKKNVDCSNCVSWQMGRAARNGIFG